MAAQGVDRVGAQERHAVAVLRLSGSGMKRLDPEVVASHLAHLLRAAWARCGSRESPEDLVQEKVAKVLSRPRVLRGGDQRSYLMQALRNTFLSSGRTAAPRPHVTATLEEIDTADHSTAASPEEAVIAAQVFPAIAQLPESFRLALGPSMSPASAGGVGQRGSLGRGLLGRLVYVLDPGWVESEPGSGDEPDVERLPGGEHEGVAPGGASPRHPPLSVHDPNGLNLFYLMLVTTIVGFLTVFQVLANAGQLPRRHQIAFVVGLAVTASLVLTVVDGPLLTRLILPVPETWGSSRSGCWRRPRSRR